MGDATLWLLGWHSPRDCSAPHLSPEMGSCGFVNRIGDNVRFTRPGIRSRVRGSECLHSQADVKLGAFFLDLSAKGDILRLHCTKSLLSLRACLGAVVKCRPAPASRIRAKKKDGGTASRRDREIAWSPSWGALSSIAEMWCTSRAEIQSSPPSRCVAPFDASQQGRN